MMLLWNGQVKDSKEAVISVFDHGFLYGMGLFETFRTYGGEPWLIERHAARLAAGCHELGIAYEPDPRRMREGVMRLLAANGLEDAYIRWSVSAGEGAIGLPSGQYESPVEIVYAKLLAPDRPDSRPAKTLRLLRLHRSTPECGSVSDRLKSFHYMNNILAKRELVAGGAGPSTEGLFLDGKGSVCEGMVSNVFWTAGGALFTPSLDTGALPGITRAYVLELAERQLGLSVNEGRYPWEAITQADEVFVTNSIQEIVPVAALENEAGGTIRRYEGAAEGGITRELMSRYRQQAEGGERDEADIL